jgi:hypothetical protein
MSGNVEQPEFEAPGPVHPAESAAVSYTPDLEAGDEVAGGTALLGIDGVEGYGRGKDDRGHDVLVVYVRDGSVASRLPASVNGLPVVPEVVGRIDAYGGSTTE